MKTNEQNEFLLAEIDWLEDELEKTLNTPIPTQDYETDYNCLKQKQEYLNQKLDKLIAENKFLLGQANHYKVFNEDLRSKNLSISSYNSILEVRLHKSDEVNFELRKENKELQDENIRLLKTKWYHLLLNIEPK